MILIIYCLWYVLASILPSVRIMEIILISLVLSQLEFCFFEDESIWIEFIDEEGVLAVKNSSEIVNCVKESKFEEI